MLSSMASPIGEKEKMNRQKEVQTFYNKYPFPNDDSRNHDWILNALPDVRPHGEILDVGCGTGEISNFLSQFGGNVCGIDLSKDSIKIAKKRYPEIEFYYDDITKKTKHNPTFDFIFSIGVLHHIPEIDKAIENIKLCMNRNTYFVVSVYNKYSTILFKPKLNSNIARTKDWTSHPYRMMYGQKEFKKILESHGLEVIKIWRNLPEIVRLLTGRGGMMAYCCRRKI